MSTLNIPVVSKTEIPKASNGQMYRVREYAKTLKAKHKNMTQKRVMQLVIRKFGIVLTDEK